MKYDLILRGEVGYADFNSETVDDFLQQRPGEPVTVLIDSFGGLLNEGLSIANAFANHGKVTVYMRGMNASAATIASMGAQRVIMDKNGLYLVHKCVLEYCDWNILTADGLREKAAELLKGADEQEKMDVIVAGMYAEKTGKTIEELLTLMTEDTWLDAKEALEWGFVDEVDDADGADEDEEKDEKTEEDNQLTNKKTITMKANELYSRFASALTGDKKLKAQIATLRAEAEEVEKENDDLKKEVDDLKSENEDLNTTIAELKTALETAQAQLKTASDKVVEMETQLKEQEDLIEELKGEAGDDDKQVVTTPEKKEGEDEDEDDENQMQAVARVFARAKEMARIK